MIRYLLSFCLIGFSFLAQAQVLTTGGKLKPEQAIMDVRHYTINLDVNIEDKSIAGNTIVKVLLTEPTKVLLLDLMDNFSVSKVLVNNRQETFTFSNELIKIDLRNTLPVGKASIQVFYSGKPHVAIRPPWEDGFTWTKDKNGTPRVEITAEGGGGKIYFPSKDHPSDEPNEGVDMHITVPGNLVVAGPGLLKKITRKGNKATYFWQTKYTINNYNIVFNAADYTVVKRPYTTVNGNVVPMEFYVLKYNAEKAAKHLDILERSLQMQEKYFGEYPWPKEKIGIVETEHLGMEHQTMNAYGANFKYSKVGTHDFDGLMHHELGHEWWGNKVTAKDWADFWIQEGICTFGDALFIRDHEGQDAYVQHFKRVGQNSIRNNKPLVLGKDIDGKTAYQGDIYPKGAFFMHTLAYIMGDEAFYPALKKFATSAQYTYDNPVVTADVEQFFSKEAGIDFKPLFDLFIFSTDKLEISMKEMTNNRYSLQLNNIKMTLPVDVVTDEGSKRLMLSDKPLVITSKTMPVVDPNWFYLRKIIIE